MTFLYFLTNHSKTVKSIISYLIFIFDEISTTPKSRYRTVMFNRVEYTRPELLLRASLEGPMETSGDYVKVGVART